MHYSLGKTSKNFQKFFNWTLEYCIDHGKKVKLVGKEILKNDKFECGGWCDGDTIIVAQKNELFEKIYVHEFCHLIQAVEKSPLWNKQKHWQIFWKCIKKQDFKITDWKHLLEVIKLEQDCEKRAIEISKKWRLFNIEKYAQQANAYLTYHHFLFLYKKWSNVGEIYNPQIIKRMPKELLSIEELSKIDMNTMEIFHKNLNKSKCK